jgi:hypothetical protein
MRHAHLFQQEALKSFVAHWTEGTA